MRPIFHPQLVNEVFGDPALYIEFMFERRALLFDLGDLRRWPTRKLLRVSDVFVSHAHMDHFVGFDHLLRVCLGRNKDLRLYGPPGFIDRVAHKLAAYSWNLVHNYENDFVVEVTEWRDDTTVRRSHFRAQTGFGREDESEIAVHDGVLLDDENLRVRAVALDHMIPCLAFALEEKRHINVWRNRVEELGLPVGPWLHELKRAVVAERPDDDIFVIRWHENGRIHTRSLPLGELKAQVLHIVPGQKITYVVDALYEPANARRIVALAQQSDTLFIESTFLAEDAERAAHTYHLTTTQAGHLAALARAQRVVPFHFSPRYSHAEVRVRTEVAAAFSDESHEEIRAKHEKKCL